MSIKDSGYLDYFGEKCIYIQDEMDYIIIPIDENANIYQHLFQKNYKLEYTTSFAKNGVVSVYETHGTGINGIRLKTNYIVECYSSDSINNFVMTGNEIDEFFSPLEHYFRLKNDEQYIPTDLLYNQETIANYNFMFEGKEIQVELFYGNVLTEGIRTDLTIHPQLRVSFEETKDTDYIKKLYDIILKFLQFVHRKQNYNISNLELWTRSDSKASHIGYMFCSLYNNNLRPQSRIDASFIYYNNKISNLFEIIAADFEHFPVKQLCKDYNNSFSFSTERFAALCSAFEYEYKHNNDYPQKSNLDCSFLKKDVVQYIKNVDEANENAVFFKKEATRRINEIGGQLGFKQRFVSAYKCNCEAFESSLPQLLFRNKDIESCARLLRELRGKVIHNDNGYQFDDKEIECIRFLEVLQFVMTLRRASFTQSEIEIIIGVLYNCNSKRFELFNKGGSK